MSTSLYGQSCFCLQGESSIVFSKSSSRDRWELKATSSRGSAITLAYINCCEEIEQVVSLLRNSINPHQDPSVFFSVIQVDSWKDTYNRCDDVHLEILNAQNSTSDSCVSLLSYKAGTAIQTIHSVASRIQQLRTRIDFIWNPDTLADFQVSKSQILELIHDFDAAATTLPEKQLQQIRDETLAKIKDLAEQKMAAAASVPKTSAHVAAKFQRKETALVLAKTSARIDELRRQLQLEESNLRAAHTELDATDAVIATCVQEAAELLQRTQSYIATDSDAANSLTNAIHSSFANDIRQFAEEAAGTVRFCLADRINDVDAERLRWIGAVCMKSATEVSQLDIQRLFNELSISVPAATIVENKLDGKLLVDEALDDSDLIEVLALKSIKDQLSLRHLRHAVKTRTLAFSLADVDADNALTWSEEQVIAWLKNYPGPESLKCLEEACAREHLNGIALLQVDKSTMKLHFGISELSTLAASVNYIREISISPGPLSQLLLHPALTLSRNVNPSTDIRLLDVSLSSPFAAYVCHRMRCEHHQVSFAPRFTVSRVSRVCVDKSREDAFCSQLNREASSRQINPLLRPENFTDSAFVSGLEALKNFFEISSFGAKSQCNIVMAWHGTQYITEVCRDGPRAFRLTDSGYFGAGSYFALEFDYAARYAMMRPPNSSGEYGVILFAVMVSAAYVVTPGRDYVPDDPVQNLRSGFSRFYSPDPLSSVALMPSYSSHFVPVKFCGFKHVISGIGLKHDTDYQAADESEAGEKCKS